MVISIFDILTPGIHLERRGAEMLSSAWWYHLLKHTQGKSEKVRFFAGTGEKDERRKIKKVAQTTGK